jgi:hypothetical protein
MPYVAFLSESQESITNAIEKGELLENDLVIRIANKYKVIKRVPLELQEDME